MEQILLEALIRHMEGREVTGDRQHSCEGKPCPSKPVAFYSRVATAVGNTRAEDVL